jgi:hypothetical protein
MRTRITSTIMVSFALVACSSDDPTAASSVSVASVERAGLQQAGVERPFTGSCSVTFNPPSFPPPPIHHQTDVGTCQLTHLGHTQFYGEQDINFASGTQSGWRRLTAANGDELYVTHTGRSTLTAPGLVSFVAEMTIVGGTGRFVGATGISRGIGTANLATNSTSVTIDGWIRY